MAQYIGQVANSFIIGENIIETHIKPAARKNKEVAKIVKIGIQADPLQTVFLNGVAIDIGKTGILQVAGVEITSIVFDKHPYKTLKDDDDNYFVNAIIDYIYEDDKQGMVLITNSDNILQQNNKQASIMEHENNE